MLLRLLGGGMAVTGSPALGNLQKTVDDQAHPEVHHQAPVKALHVVLGEHRQMRHKGKVQPISHQNRDQGLEEVARHAVLLDTADRLFAA